MYSVKEKNKGELGNLLNCFLRENTRGCDSFFWCYENAYYFAELSLLLFRRVHYLPELT
jgi:hypothetical protein